MGKEQVIEALEQETIAKALTSKAIVERLSPATCRKLIEMLPTQGGLGAGPLNKDLVTSLDRPLTPSDAPSAPSWTVAARPRLFVEYCEWSITPHYPLPGPRTLATRYAPCSGAIPATSHTSSRAVSSRRFVALPYSGIAVVTCVEPVAQVAPGPPPAAPVRRWRQLQVDRQQRGERLRPARCSVSRPPHARRLAST